MFRRGRDHHQELIEQLLAAPQRWEQLRAPIREAAAGLGLSDSARERVHQEIALREWRSALSGDRLTVAAEERASQVTAGLSVGMDVLQGDMKLMERAIVGRANDRRFPTPVRQPQVPSLQSGETVHLEFPAAVGEYRQVRDVRGSAWGISVPIGHGLAYTIMLGDSKERTRTKGVVAERGFMAVTSRRVVYWGERRAYETTYEQVIELRRRPHSVVLLSTARDEAPEFIVPLPDAVGAVINLQANELRWR